MSHLVVAPLHRLDTSKNPDFARFSFFNSLVSLRMSLRGMTKNRVKRGARLLKRQVRAP